MSYGTWKSPIQSSLIVEKMISLSAVHIDKQGHVYWLEFRPSENGRYVIKSTRTEEDLIPEGFNARTRVHEYGGGSYIAENNQVYFSNFVDQRIYHVDLQTKTEPKAITEESNSAALRYADFTVDSAHDQLICVHEDHKKEDDVQNSLVAISTKTSTMVKLTSGYDFYSTPRVSHDGKYLTWICWNHPNMPWDQTELWVAEIDDSETYSLKNPRKLFGDIDESIILPQWSPDGKYIYFSSDRNNWWNIYRTTIDGQLAECIHEMEAEFGGPLWQFATNYFDFDSDGNVISIFWKNGIARLARINPETKEFTSLSIADDYTDIRSLAVFQHKVYFLGASATKPSEFVELDMKSETMKILSKTSTQTIDPRYVSIPEMITFKSGDAFAHGIYYPPKNDDYTIPDGCEEYPPLLVRTHGGPTSAATSAFNLGIQYWTSRGFAMLDVNYRGSSGYGRKYRTSLNNNWGIYDVEDSVCGAQYLVEQKKADRNRLTIDGGSAGGYTTLCALTMKDYFSAGASRYGVSDLTALALDTHKFESRYLDRLIGEFPAQKEIYEQRSPINHVANLSKPIIFFQGTEDKIVPPSQSELMVNALRAKKLPVAYVLFEGEQHGFRKAENIKKSLDIEFYFFSKIFGFKMADEIEPVPIENFEN